VPRLYDLSHMRNIASWPTSMPARRRSPSASFYYTGKVHRMGEVHDGAATMDWMEQ